MHLLRIKAIFATFLAVLCCSFAQAQDLSQYTLGAGDVIKISVYDEPDLTLETILTDTGTINYPLLGEIQATNLTVDELEKSLIDGLKPDFLLRPDVNIQIIEYRRFYIHGEVEQPGGYAFQPGLTLRKAIALAGGMTDRASKSKMLLISDQSDDKTAQKIEMETSISPGDIINIEQSFF